MPQAVFKSVYAVSSEDPVHQAANLLKNQSGKKWKTRSSGEASAYVILQLEKSQKITGIDIGNEHAAFVEVLVGKNAYSQEEFKEILIMCSFMTPIESKNSSNTNRVRCFAKNALVESIAEDKWDLVKVMCTQPFNKHVQYGLSFITLHIEEEKQNKPVPKPLVPAKYIPKPAEDKNSSGDRLSFIGKFKLREDSPDSESENTTSLFNRWKETKGNSATKNLSAAAAIRDASSPSYLKERSESLKPSKILQKPDAERRDKRKSKDETVLDRNRNDLLFDEEDDIPNDKLERRISADQDRVNKQKKATGKPEKKEKQDKPSNTEKTDKNKTIITPKATPTRNSDSKGNVRKRSSPSPSGNSAKKLKPDKETQYRPFDKLLQGVVLVISGIQNPDRANLRKKALELGAKYKPDWDDSCTHLICAFKNTPKYNQVKGKGKIVTKSWIEKCFSLKKRLPWRRFAMVDKELDKSESEDEIHDVSLRPKDRSKSPPQLAKESSPLDTRNSPKTGILDCPEKESIKGKESPDDTLAYYDLGDEKKARSDLTSGSDTEEEIDRIRNNEMQSHKNGDKRSVYDLTTDEEEYTKSLGLETEDSGTDFFKNSKFFVSGKLGSVDQIKLKQYISKYKGEVVNAIVDADYAITDVEISAPSGFSGETVKPLWIYECNDMESLIPTKRYKV